MFGTFMAIKLTTNGYGAVIYGGGPSDFGLPGTFTYTLAGAQIRYVTNDTPFLVGRLRYDAVADIISYQLDADTAMKLRESSKPMILRRDASALRGAMLGSVIGATNYSDLMARMGRFFDSATNHPEWLQTNSAAHKSAQPNRLSQ